MSDRAIRDAILQITGNHLSAKVYSIDAIVVSVDPVKRTCVCQVVSGNANNILTGVRLMAASDDGFLLIPADSSNVCIILSDGVEPYISQYSEIDSIIMRGGDLGGIVRVVDLTSKLNALENKINSLLSAYNAHTHPVISTSSPSGPTASTVSGSLAVTNRADIENTKITQG